MANGATAIAPRTTVASNIQYQADSFSAEAGHPASAELHVGLALQDDFHRQR
jgi:hypothetical protein